ncbi:MMPL family transporter [Aeromicrobium sp.]|uniref:MMPL family transporter n=1 Tax=Aeromicrobium sp. TaxID=1871063 RepID=UPI002FCBAE98
MFAALARLANTHPRRVLVLTVFFFVIGGAVGGPVAGLLNSDNDSFSDTSSESTKALDRIEKASGESAVPDLIAILPSNDGKALEETFGILESEENVSKVAGGPEAGPAFESKDGSKTYVVAIYKSHGDPDGTTEHLREELKDVDGVQVGGIGPAFQQVNEQVEGDIIKAELIAFPILFFVSLWVFRSAVAALLPLLVGGLTIVGSLTVVRGLNEVVDISIFALNLITGLGLGLAIDYSLFLVQRYREELTRSGPGPEAIRRTVATAGRTVAFSAVTVAGAGLALLVFPLRFLYSMGIGVFVVSLMAAAVSLIVLPALFAVLQHRVNAGSPKRWQRAQAAELAAEKHGFWYRLSQFVMRFPVAIALTGTAILLAFGAPFLGVKFTGVDATVLPDDASARQVDTALRTEFTGAESGPIIIAIDAAESDVTEVSDYTDQLRDLSAVQAVAEPLYKGDNTWQVDVISKYPTMDEKSRDLATEIRELDSPNPVLVGGQAADQNDQFSAIVAGAPLALLILVIITLITLFLMTGSVILPIKALVMNVLTIGATFGILVLIFQDGRFQGPLDYTSQGALESTQPVFLFAVVFGLSTDYAVFLLTRIKEARDAGAGDREAIALGLQRTGRIVTAAALLFAIALGSFATSEIIFIKQLGIGTAVAVLIDATIVRAMLVPSLMALLGKRNWWAPKPLRKLHDRIGLSEGDPEELEKVKV